MYNKDIPLSFLFEKKTPLYSKGFPNRKIIKICKITLQKRYRLVVHGIKIQKKIITCENFLIGTGWL